MTLVDDLGAAVVGAVGTNVATFSPALSTAADIEYAADGRQTIPQGNDTRAYVIPNDPIVEGGGEYAESTFTNFGFDVIFDIAATNESQEQIAAVHNGMLSTFSDAGANFFAAFTDTGSNRLGGSGRVTIESSATEIQDDVDRPRITYTLAVRMWHTVPLS